MSVDPSLVSGYPTEGEGEPEEAVWKGRPALRSEIWVWLGLAAVWWIAGGYMLDAASALERAGFRIGEMPLVGLVIDDAETLLNLLGLVAVGAAIWRILDRLLTGYELTTRYFYQRSGVLNRTHEQLELHRVRDVEVLEPIHLRVLGLGRVIVHSVDRTTPTVRVKAQSRAVVLGPAIYELVKQEQKRMGYREFEGTSSL